MSEVTAVPDLATDARRWDNDRGMVVGMSADQVAEAEARYLDAAFGRATATCAEAVSARAVGNEPLGEIAALQPEFRRTLQMELPIGVLDVARKLDFLSFDGNSGKTLGGVDVVVEGSVRSAGPMRALAELKWAGDRETFAWSVFDALKMASARSSGIAAVCYVVVGAPVTLWKERSSAQLLLTDGHYDVAQIVQTYDGRSALYSADVAWPRILPAAIELVVVGDAPVSVQSVLWKLRCVRVGVFGNETVQLLEGRCV